MKAIYFTPTAARQLKKLPVAIRDQIHAKLERYAEDGTGDVTAMKGTAGARLRMGDYRVIFGESPTEITVDAVGHRREIYR